MRTDGFFSTADAASAARSQVARLAPAAAHDQRAAAQLARAALFDEALLAALKARLTELRGVAR
ncbi:MAG TPA: hypothetical protein VMD91_06755 [Candidatus Sulfotelmatobacter sp.]|nr:hypothetical protein [Candidatus Sulfotelmatobacter sp.]